METLRIILVGNKIDQHITRSQVNEIDLLMTDLNKDELLRKYKTIQSFYQTSCSKNKGMSEVKQAIEKNIKNLPHVFDKFNKHWYAVKQILEKMRKSFIDYKEYQVICKKNQIKEANDQNLLLSFLHDLGVILNFREDWLKDWPVKERKPQVIIQKPLAAGSKVLTDTQNAVFAGIRLHYNDVVAVEMEGLGFLKAANQNKTDALVIRGISDLLENKAESDGEGWQEKQLEMQRVLLFI